MSQPNDSAEVEADAVADQVVQMPEPQTALARRAADGIGIQRKCEDCQEEAARQVEESDDEQISRMPEDDDKEMVSAKAEEEEAARMAADEEEVTRMAADEEEMTRMATDEEEVTRMAMDEDDTVSAKAETGAQSRVSSGVESQVRTLNSAGAPLSDETRKFFEPRFGADFSGVRIHNGSQAAGVARQLNARAFTVGNHITFGAGQYSPSSSDGRRLIAHELTHVLQQRGQSPKTRS
ncbi:MAG: DUF4157 domain-containing protein [Myxococcota bacterium]